MLSEDHDYKIRKYTNMLKTSTRNRSEYYQRKANTLPPNASNECL
jgi:hypothetical protein